VLSGGEGRSSDDSSIEALLLLAAISLKSFFGPSLDLD